MLIAAPWREAQRDGMKVMHRFRPAGLHRPRAKAILANEQVIEGARTVLMDHSVLFAAPAAIIGVGESATAT